MRPIPNFTPGANVIEVEDGAWNLEIPPGRKDHYRLAQIDDYAGNKRSAFPWKPPLTLNLKACVSAVDIAGTWGFGFVWDDRTWCFEFPHMRQLLVSRHATVHNR